MMRMMRRIPVLVIEEDADLRESIRSNLERDGFKVYTAENASSGINVACKHKLRLILLDVSEGSEQAVSTLKLNYDTGGVPVIALTEADSNEAVSEASGIHADGYITKPFDGENLAEVLRLKLENCEAVMDQTLRRARKKVPVLVIDDEEYVRNLVQYSLSSAGFEVYAASDGPSGIKTARKYKPRLIILDVMMPGMDGLEVLLNLKWNKKTKRIPVFMLTGRSLMQDMDKAFARRADDYITKPFDVEKLGGIVKEKLEKLKGRV